MLRLRAYRSSIRSPRPCHRRTHNSSRSRHTSRRRTRPLHPLRLPTLLRTLLQLRQIRLRPPHTLRNLHQHRVLLQRHLIALLQSRVFLPVHVADEVARHVVHHDALVEGVEAQEAILPALLLAADVVGVEAVEFEDGRGVLARWDGERGRARAVDGGCHGLLE